jgi:hypothetical protein
MERDGARIRCKKGRREKEENDFESSGAPSVTVTRASAPNREKHGKGTVLVDSTHLK